MGWIKQIGKLLLVLILQVLLFNHIQIVGWCFPMMYILFLINLPAHLPRWTEMLIGALVGIILDIWYSSIGVHMAACVVLSFLRPILLHNLVQDVERVTDSVNRLTIGRMEYMKCTIILTFTHHLLVFTLEAWNFQNWWLILLQTLVSSMMTLLVILGYDSLRR